MINPNLLETTELERLLQYGEKKDGSQRLVAPLNEAVAISFTMTPSKIHNESHRFQVEAALPYAPSRLKDVYVVLASVWRVRRNGRANENPLTFAEHLPDVDRHFSKKMAPEELDKEEPALQALRLFDKQSDRRKGFIEQRPVMEPDIFSSEGLEKVVKSLLVSMESADG
jgi:hypothetical protein